MMVAVRRVGIIILGWVVMVICGGGDDSGDGGW
jgi:hypothetical protein